MPALLSFLALFTSLYQSMFLAGIILLFFPGILMIYFNSFCNSGLMAKQWHGFYFLTTLFLSLKSYFKNIFGLYVILSCIFFPSKMSLHCLWAWTFSIKKSAIFLFSVLCNVSLFSVFKIFFLLSFQQFGFPVCL